jgi:hypothetical protein
VSRVNNAVGVRPSPFVWFLMNPFVSWGAFLLGNNSKIRCARGNPYTWNARPWPDADTRGCAGCCAAPVHTAKRFGSPKSRLPFAGIPGWRCAADSVLRTGPRCDLTAGGNGGQKRDLKLKRPVLALGFDDRQFCLGMQWPLVLFPLQ